MTPERWIVESTHDLAKRLPEATLDALVSAIQGCSEGSLRSDLARRIAHHEHRALALEFIDRWSKEAREIDARAVALSLQAAAHAERTRRSTQSAELAWTGPNNGTAPFRRTEQAILQVLDSAQRKITVVSFAVYRIPNVAQALIRAASRGVRLTIILETPDRIEGQGEYSTIQALGREVADCSTVYYWPREQRPVDVSGKVGILHVKCVAADGRWLFVSSANLTRNAFNLNMELGLLITGGHAAPTVERMFADLIDAGVLTEAGTGPKSGPCTPNGR